ncbi:MAG TPA: hypothetical protein P5232_04010 [Candidatus Moranbacteria bacterium]|nr:hypothetical protein [Candidatus Moranbacteria bacterium]
MATSKLTSVIILVIGEGRIKETEAAKKAYDYKGKIRDIEKRLDKGGKAYISSAIQELDDLFGSYIKPWEYKKIETELNYNIK